MLCRNISKANGKLTYNKDNNVKKLKGIVNDNRIMFDFINNKVNIYVIHTHNELPKWKTLLISFNYSTNKWKINKCSIINKYKSISNDIKYTFDRELPYVRQKKLLYSFQHEWMKEYRSEDINSIINYHDLFKKLSKQDHNDINAIVDNLCFHDKIYLSEVLLEHGFDDPDEHRVALYRMTSRLKK